MAKAKTKKPPKSAKPKADNGPSWRRMTLTEAFDDDFDLPKGVITTLTNFGVKTCGELADRLLANNTFGLKLIEVQSLCESIEQMSSDDDNPVKFNEATESEEAAESDNAKPIGDVLNEIPAAAAKPADEPMTLEELAAYDAETVRLVSAAEEVAKAAESTYENSKAVASEDKKRFEAKLADLRGLIHERSENRGKRPKAPEPTLLDSIPKWKEYGLDRIRFESFDTDIRHMLTEAGITTLGELSDQIGPAYLNEAGSVFGLQRDVIDSIREQIHAIIDAEFKQPETESDLYKQYPIERWTKFGLTKKDVEKLHACETKGTASGFPIITMGDLQRFVTPNPASPAYTQSVKDIKGIGDAGCDRIGEAELLFWSWWRAGGEAEFAAELNPPTETPAAPESEAA
jgi:hypothetical protein